MTEHDYELAGRTFTRPQWDAICRRCGGCCHEKEVQADGRVLDLDVPCSQLTDNLLCRVYDRRVETEKECNLVTPGVVRQGKILPRSCAYLQLYEDLLVVLEEEIRVTASRRSRAKSG